MAEETHVGSLQQCHLQLVKLSLFFEEPPQKDNYCKKESKASKLKFYEQNLRVLGMKPNSEFYGYGQVSFIKVKFDFTIKLVTLNILKSLLIFRSINTFLKPWTQCGNFTSQNISLKS